jgi:hypothetical protein
MPYFVRIGPNKANVGKVESRGYQILRRGTIVLIRFAGISVQPDRRIFWATHVLYHRYKRRTVALAKRKAAELGRERETKGYRRLLPGNKIERKAGTEYRRG